VHGYDESKTAVWADATTGAAPLVWDRADGWYLWSLLEVLQLLPPTHAGYSRLLGYFTSLAAGLRASQDDAGGWWLILSDPYVGAAGNYMESSGSSMFTFGWLRGMRLGLLGDEYLEPARKAYSNLVDEFVIWNDNGTLSWNGTVSVGSLSSNGTYEVLLAWERRAELYHLANSCAVLH
jgi:rhamnogalacturonyl hydrolase YesR